jgi:hypothetical protein
MWVRARGWPRSSWSGEHICVCGEPRGVSAYPESHTIVERTTGGALGCVVGQTPCTRPTRHASNASSRTGYRGRLFVPFGAPAGIRRLPASTSSRVPDDTCVRSRPRQARYPQCSAGDVRESACPHRADVHVLHARTGVGDATVAVARRPAAWPDATCPLAPSACCRRWCSTTDAICRPRRPCRSDARLCPTNAWRRRRC